MRKRSEAPPPPAFLPADYEAAEVSAIQAVANGRADEIQQKRAMKAIIEKVCDTYGLGWHPNGNHESSFAAGRRFAGMQIVKAINTPAEKFKRDPNA